MIAFKEFHIILKNFAFTNVEKSPAKKLNKLCRTFCNVLVQWSENLNPC